METVKMRTCTTCGRELPETLYELYPTGSRRRMCRQCHYRYHVVPAKRKWRMKQLARVIVGRLGEQ